MNPIELGKFIAQLRSEKELTQEELAEKLFIDKRKVSRWECGTSVPEFDMLIKLSEIFDVTLFELSICQKITDKKINKRDINRFKNINDLKKLKLKRIILMIFIALLLAFFISTTIYTFKHNGKIELYELESMNDEFVIKGNFIKLKDYSIINVVDIYSNNIDYNNNDCQYEIYNDDKRLSYTTDTSNTPNKIRLFGKYENTYIKNKIITFKIICQSSNEKINYSFNTKLIEVYNNRFF